jgi:hypothetical protein
MYDNTRLFGTTQYTESVIPAEQIYRKMATGGAPSDSERDRLIVQPRSLVEAEAIDFIDLDGKSTIRTVLSVHKCPSGFRSRLGYHALLFLKKPGDVERYVGYIIGWRISKPTGVSPQIDPVYYKEDWYYGKERDHDRDSRLLASCFRAIIAPGSLYGENYEQVLDETVKTQLQDEGNEVVFIQTVYIKWREDPEDEDTEVGRHSSSLPIEKKLTTS